MRGIVQECVFESDFYKIYGIISDKENDNEQI